MHLQLKQNRRATNVMEIMYLEEHFCGGNSGGGIIQMRQIDKCVQ